MKKVLFALVASAFCLSAMAVETAHVRITVKSASNTTNYVSYTEDDTFAEEFKSGVDAKKLFSTPLDATVFAWTKASYADSLSSLGLSLLEDVPFIVKTNKVDTEYSLNFKFVTGRELKILDKVTGVETVIAEDGSYAFTIEDAQKDQVIADRFVLAPHAVPTEFKVCHQYGKIIVDNPETTPMDVVLDGDVIGVAAATRFGSEIEIPATVAAGQHTLEINNQTLIISVQ